MLTVMCVLRSSLEYNPKWVEKLQRAVDRHMTVPHTFACLSDTEVPCERIPMAHDWPGWWAKIELFRPGVICGPTLYLDLDTVIVGNIDSLASFDDEFAIMRNLNNPHMPGSAVMWFKSGAPREVYDRFRANPAAMMAEYGKANGGSYIGDQAFIWDTLHRKTPYLSDKVPGLIRSYRRHCAAGVPAGCSVVAFGGMKKPSTVSDVWVQEAWR